MRLISLISQLSVACFAAIAFVALATGSVCGSGNNETICFASIDQSAKLSQKQRGELAVAGTKAIDIVSDPQFAKELTDFYVAHGQDGLHREYWKGFDPKTATANVKSNFNGLHIETIGGLRAWFSSKFMNNLAYEGGTRRDGSREILLNRNRLDRSSASIVGTYVHEAAHKAGFSHRPNQTKDQKCEPPYVMGQIAEKLADPAAWKAKQGKSDVCRFL